MTNTDKRYMVVYTDGSQQRNNIGYGYHGYISVKNSDKPVPAADQHVCWDKGYVAKKDLINPVENMKLDWSDQEYDGRPPEDFTDIKKWHQPVKYFDYSKYDLKMTSNNQAEMQAVIEALHLAKESNVDMITVITDSQYVTLGLAQWVEKWIGGNWMKKDGNPVLNKDYWLNMLAAKKALEEDGIEVDVQWCPAHVGIIGNEIADTLAGAGTMLAENKAEHITRIVEDPKKILVYWKGFIIRNPLLCGKRVVFGDEGLTTPATYWLAEVGKDIYNYGKKSPETAYSVVMLDEPDPTIETVIARVRKDTQNEGTIFTGTMDQIFHKRIAKDLEYLQGNILRRPSLQRYNYQVISGTGIVTEANPVNLMLRGVRYHEALENLLILATENDVDDKGKVLTDEMDIVLHDVTELIYDTNPKGALVPSELIKSAGKVVKMPPIRDNENEVLFQFGHELPAKPSLTKLAKESPTIYQISWVPKEGGLRYGGLVLSNVGKAIYTNPIINYIFGE